MNECEVTVRQISGYYVLDLRFFFSWTSFATQAEASMHQVVSAVHDLANDIEENFEVSKIRVYEDHPSIHIKCMRDELRKIETWLSIGNYTVVPLRRWKNERT
jgi:hypothetical protein